MQDELRSIAAMARPGELGNLTLAAEDARAEWGWTRLEQTAQDLRYAVRSLWRVPGFSVVGVLTLAVGIGASTALFSAIDGLLLHPDGVADVGRLVHTSTSEVYGTAIRVPIDEDHPLQPQSPYSASKIGGDMMALSYWHAFELPVAVVRPFNTYGPRQSTRAVIPTIISQALSGDTLRLGSLDPRRDLTYVEDTVSGFLAAASAPDAVGR